MIFLGIYKQNVKINVKNEPNTKPNEASQLVNASIKETPSKKTSSINHTSNTADD